MELEGNKLYVQNQPSSEEFPENYRKTLQFVYNPKNEVRLKKMMDNKFNYWQAYKINQYKANEQKLRKYVSHLQEPSYLDSMYAKTWEWLPERLQVKSLDTKIFIIGIDNDALVEKGKIVFTLWNVYCQDKLKYGILAGHEIHHVLRKPVDFEVTPAEEGVFYALQSVLNEGSADKIDKKYSFDKTREVVYEYHFDELFINQTVSLNK